MGHGERLRHVRAVAYPDTAMSYGKTPGDSDSPPEITNALPARDQRDAPPLSELTDAGTGRDSAESYASRTKPETIGSSLSGRPA